MNKEVLIKLLMEKFNAPIADEINRLAEGILKSKLNIDEDDILGMLKFTTNLSIRF